MFFQKSCKKCGGDVTLDSYENEDESYDLYCIQCGNRRDFFDANIMATLYKRLEKDGRKKLYKLTTI